MDLDALYQDIILDHYRNPRHYGPIPDADVLVDEENPLCGDHIRLAATVADGRIGSIRFDGQGCAISMASTSMMAEALAGVTVDDARRLIDRVLAGLRGDAPLDIDAAGDVAALEGVKRFPMRVKCATLGWHAIAAALRKLAP